MDIEEIEIDGQLIVISLPVSDLEVDGKTVSYRDRKGPCKQIFSSPSLARKFTLMMKEL